jgi:hypothetical protein
MYADPKNIRQHRVSMSLTEAERRALEAIADLNGIQPSVLARDLVTEFLFSRLESNSAHASQQLRSAH